MPVSLRSFSGSNRRGGEFVEVVRRTVIGRYALQPHWHSSSKNLIARWRLAYRHIGNAGKIEYIEILSARLLTYLRARAKHLVNDLRGDRRRLRIDEQVANVLAQRRRVGTQRWP